MSFPTLQRAFADERHTGAARSVLLAVAFHADNDGVAWPGRATVASKANCTERTARRVMGELTAAGTIYYAEGRGRGNKSLYFLTCGLDVPTIARVLRDRFELDDEAALATAIVVKQRQIKGDIPDPLFGPIKGDNSRTEKGTSVQKKGTEETLKGDICAPSPPPNDNISNPLLSPRTNRNRQVKRKRGAQPLTRQTPPPAAAPRRRMQIPPSPSRPTGRTTSPRPRCSTWPTSTCSALSSSAKPSGTAPA